MVTFLVNIQHLSMALSAVTGQSGSCGSCWDLCPSPICVWTLHFQVYWNKDGKLTLPQEWFFPGSQVGESSETGDIRVEWHGRSPAWDSCSMTDLWLVVLAFLSGQSPALPLLFPPPCPSSHPGGGGACSFLYCLFLLSTGVSFSAKSLELGVPPLS